MRVLVSDTSVFIDLERGDLLEAVFQLDYEFVVPDLLFEEELKPYNGEDLLKHGLQVAELDGAGVEQAQQCWRDISPLSLPDAFAYTLAEINAWVLLTGDGALRALAKRNKVSCHGVLWVIDELDAASIVDSRSLHRGLTRISSHPRCRLPRAEINKRLKRFGNFDT